ncbi:MAG: gephyrin-like molybdotransferase Glp [Chloroflexota bacterium]|nr:gephyrin-like molybdotransferase Glp [Chloroflexota bacterium]
MKTTSMKPERPILSVEEARSRILEHVSPLDAQRVSILDALGCVLAEDVVAPDNVPPHDNAAMDGYALHADDLRAAGETPRLRVIGELPAGEVWEGALGTGEAIRIMTGAPMPADADTVVRFENTRREGKAVLIEKIPARGRNVRRAGEDVQEGQLVLPKGTPLRPQEIGMLASLGYDEALVHRRPRVTVLATGDEVVPPGASLTPGKIRNINSYSNAAQIQKAGGVPLVMEVAPDRADTLAQRLRRALERQPDLIVTSGGVSVGDFDLVKQVLASEGQMDFWWVNMKPGKPMAFGTIDDVPLLALPGNPVAAMISFFLFGRPAMRKMLGYTTWEPRKVEAHLREGIARKDNRRHYLRVKLYPTGDGLEAELTGEQGSGILMSMVAADGLAVIPEESGEIPTGSTVEVLLFDEADRFEEREP